MVPRWRPWWLSVAASGGTCAVVTRDALSRHGMPVQSGWRTLGEKCLPDAGKHPGWCLQPNAPRCLAPPPPSLDRSLGPQTVQRAFKLTDDVTVPKGAFIIPSIVAACMQVCACARVLGSKRGRAPAPALGLVKRCGVHTHHSRRPSGRHGLGHAAAGSSSAWPLPPCCATLSMATSSMHRRHRCG